MLLNITVIVLLAAVGVMVASALYIKLLPKDPSIKDITNILEGINDSLDKIEDKIDQKLSINSDIQKSDNLGNKAKGVNSDK